MTSKKQSTQERALRIGTAGPVGTGKSPIIGALSYEHGETGGWRVSHDIGVKVRTPVDPFYRFRANYNKQLDENWSAEIRQKLWVFNRAGFGSDTQLHFNRYLSGGRYLRFISRYNYKEDRDYAQYAQIAQISRALGEDRTVSYEIGILGGSEFSTKINQHFVQMKYRTTIYEDWLLLQLTPQIVASAEDNWQTEFRITAHIDIIFADL